MPCSVDGALKEQNQSPSHAEAQGQCSAASQEANQFQLRRLKALSRGRGGHGFLNALLLQQPESRPRAPEVLDGVLWVNGKTAVRGQMPKESWL